jgi:ankyrin repeat protein
MIVTVNNSSSAAMDKELLDAAKEGKTQEVQRLIEAGADLSTKDGSGLTALHLASWNGHRATAAVLLEAGAPVHAKSNYGSTPLHAASDKGHHDTAQLLLNKGATVDATNNGGLTPLHYGTNFFLLYLGELEEIRRILHPEPSFTLTKYSELE